jgi:hypothetical protein
MGCPGSSCPVRRARRDLRVLLVLQTFKNNSNIITSPKIRDITPFPNPPSSIRKSNIFSFFPPETVLPLCSVGNKFYNVTECVGKNYKMSVTADWPWIWLNTNTAKPWEPTSLNSKEFPKITTH